MSGQNEMSEKRKLQLAKLVSISEFNDRIKARLKDWGRTDRYPTGWTQFDKYLYGGFGLETDGELVVIGGETKIGKSKFAANVAMRIVQNIGEQIDYITLENSYDQTGGMLCKIAGVEDLYDYKDTIYLPDEELIFGDEAWNAEDLLTHMEFAVEAWKVKFFVLDHLNFMFENEDQAREELLRVRVVMRKLSRFCVKHKATVLAISHMRKQGNGKSNENVKPTWHDIYGSQAISGAATKIILVSKGIRS